MLSWSSQETEQRINLLPIAEGSGDPLLPGGSELIDFVNVTLAGNGISAARNAVADTIGPAAAVDAAAVIGNFEMMNRIADGVGMPVGAGTRTSMAGIIRELRLDGFPHA
jgi:hypothetical protein